MSVGVVKQVTNAEIMKELEFIRATWVEQRADFDKSGQDVARLEATLADLTARSEGWAERFGNRLDQSDEAWKAVSALAHQMSGAVTELKEIVAEESKSRVRSEQLNEARHREVLDRADQLSIDVTSSLGEIIRTLAASHGEHADIRQQAKEVASRAEAVAAEAAGRAKDAADAAVASAAQAKAALVRARARESRLTRVILGVGSVLGTLSISLAWLSWDHLAPWIAHLIHPGAKP